MARQNRWVTQIAHLLERQATETQRHGAERVAHRPVSGPPLRGGVRRVDVGACAPRLVPCGSVVEDLCVSVSLWRFFVNAIAA
jgi:hypothetical protein